MKIQLNRRALVALGLSPALWTSTVFAKQYPERPIQLVVGSAPGGFTDVLGRIVAQRLSEKFGEAVVVDNRAGASTTIGTNFVAKAAPDGYTLLMGHFAGISVAPSLIAQLPYDPVKDLTPIVRVASTPVILTLTPSVPARNLNELIQYLRQNPNKASFASSGVGTAQHLAAVQFMRATGTKMIHVPYKGSSAAMTDLLAGRVEMNFDSPPNVLSMIKAGKLRAIAITSLKRSPLLPEVPTMDEAGLPKFEMNQWFGIMGPARLPRPIVELLNKEINAILAAPEVVERISSLGGEVLGGTPEQFADYQKADVAYWAKLMRESGIKAE
jgi:tripartite-type tricarboxylate transporter receptor subunit TctC